MVVISYEADKKLFACDDCAISKGSVLLNWRPRPVIAVRFKTCGWTITWIEVKWLTVITIKVGCVVGLKAQSTADKKENVNASNADLYFYTSGCWMVMAVSIWIAASCLTHTVEQRNIPRAIPKHIFITVIEWGRVSKLYLATSLQTYAHPMV